MLRPAVLMQHADRLQQALQQLSSALRSGAFLAGSSITLADVSAVTSLVRAHAHAHGMAWRAWWLPHACRRTRMHALAGAIQ